MTVLQPWLVETRWEPLRLHLLFRPRSARAKRRLATAPRHG